MMVRTSNKGGMPDEKARCPGGGHLVFFSFVTKNVTDRALHLFVNGYLALF